MSGPAEVIFSWMMLAIVSGAALAALIFIAWVATFAFYFVKAIIDNLVRERRRSRNARQTRKSESRHG